jgi:hypothetical protein
MVDLGPCDRTRKCFEVLTFSLCYDSGDAMIKYLELSSQGLGYNEALSHYLYLFLLANKYMFSVLENKNLYLIWRTLIRADAKNMSEEDLDEFFGPDSVMFRVVYPYYPGWMARIGWLICCRFPEYALSRPHNQVLFSFLWHVTKSETADISS